MRFGPDANVLRRLSIAMFAAASVFALPAVAQTYPSKPVRIIVLGKGGAPDLGEGVAVGAETGQCRPDYGTAFCGVWSLRCLLLHLYSRFPPSLKPIRRSRCGLLFRIGKGGAPDLGEGVGVGAETGHGRPAYGTAFCGVWSQRCLLLHRYSRFPPSLKPIRRSRCGLLFRIARAGASTRWRACWRRR